MSIHRQHCLNEIRELEPTPSGYARYELTGRACHVCTCGALTGFVPSEQAIRAFEDHLAVVCTCGEPQGDDEDDSEARRRRIHSRSCAVTR